MKRNAGGQFASPAQVQLDRVNASMERQSQLRSVKSLALIALASPIKRLKRLGKSAYAYA